MGRAPGAAGCSPEDRRRQSSCASRGDCVELDGFVYKSCSSHVFQRVKVSLSESP